MEKLCGFEVTKKIGSGSYGIVYEVNNRQQVIKRYIDHKHTPDFFNELDIINKVRHPYCINAEEIKVDDEGKFCIVMKRYDSNLASYIRDNSLSKKVAFEISYKILSGLHYLHSNNIIHQDFHVGNILIDVQTQTPVITDYGLSRNYSSRIKYIYPFIVEELRPPEILLHELTENECENDDECQYYYGKEVDVWALGLVIYSLFKRRYFIPSDTIKFNYDYLVFIQQYIGLSSSQSERLSRYLKNHPEITVKIISTSPFEDLDKNTVDYLKLFLRADPLLRYSTGKIIQKINVPVFPISYIEYPVAIVTGRGKYSQYRPDIYKLLLKLIDQVGMNTVSLTMNILDRYMEAESSNLSSREIWLSTFTALNMSFALVKGENYMELALHYAQQAMIYLGDRETSRDELDTLSIKIMKKLNFSLYSPVES